MKTITKSLNVFFCPTATYLAMLHFSNGHVEVSKDVGNFPVSSLRRTSVTSFASRQHHISLCLPAASLPWVMCCCEAEFAREIRQSSTRGKTRALCFRDFHFRWSNFPTHLNAMAALLRERNAPVTLKKSQKISSSKKVCRDVLLKTSKKRRTYSVWFFWGGIGTQHTCCCVWAAGDANTDSFEFRNQRGGVAPSAGWTPPTVPPYASKLGVTGGRRSCFRHFVVDIYDQLKCNCICFCTGSTQQEPFPFCPILLCFYPRP